MYPESFKQQVVQEYEAGGVSLQALRRKYRIGGTTTVSKWLHRYGRGVEMVSSKSATDSSAESSAEALGTVSRIAALEAEVAHMREKVIVFETLVEVAGEYVNMDLKKSLGHSCPSISHTYCPRARTTGRDKPML